MSAAIVRRATARAVKQRLQLGLGNDPILGLRELIEGQGRLVYETRIDDGSLSGCFAIIGEDDWIMVNTAHSVGRRRFTLAHEYCHSLEHRDLEFVVCTKEKPPHEVYADAFAAAFLMPSDAAESFFATDIAAGTGVAAHRVIEFCYTYGASFEAAVYRLANLGLVTTGNLNTLLSEQPVKLARNLGYDIADPTSPFFRSDAECEYELAGGLPRAYRAAALQAFDEERISESKLASLLGVDADDLDDILGPEELDEVSIVR